MKDFDEIYLDIWQIMADSGEIWLHLAGNVKIYDGVGGMRVGRSENPKKSAEVCARSNTLPHPEGWATDFDGYRPMPPTPRPHDWLAGWLAG